VRHPESLDKLKVEIGASLGGRNEITQADIEGMNYLRAVIHESMSPPPDGCLTQSL
jgi:hypothetical protein